MDWLDRVVHAFIMTFGITQPSAEGRRAANLVIGGMLLVVVAAVLIGIVLGVRQLL